jgi:hypothetical protein
MEGCGVVGIVGCEHAGGGGGGFGEWGRAVEDGDAGAAVVEFEGEGEADDAGSGDAYVGLLHGTSLDGPGEVIVSYRAAVRGKDSEQADFAKMMRLTIAGTRRTE